MSSLDDSLESIKTTLIEHMEEASSYEDEMDRLSLILDEKSFYQKVCNAFFNLIADPELSPESIIHLLDIYTDGLEGFSKNKSLQTLIAFACLEAFAIRRPKELSGPWETLSWTIVKYSSISNTSLGKELSDFQENNFAVLEFITDICSQELCPNPCLRLELLRIIRSFNYKNYSFNGQILLPDKIISTLFELCENYSSLTIDQVPNFTPMELYYLMDDNHIEIANPKIINNDDLKFQKSKIIASVLKLTRNFALLEQEKHQRITNQAIEYEPWKAGIEKQLYACLSFCGLICLTGDDIVVNRYMISLAQAVGNDSLLQNCVVDTLDTITHVALSLPDNDELKDSIIHVKDKIFNKLFKAHVKQLPSSLYIQEINGGITPATEYRLKYLQNNMIGQYNDLDNGILHYDEVPDGTFDLSGIVDEDTLSQEACNRPFSNCVL